MGRQRCDDFTRNVPRAETEGRGAPRNGDHGNPAAAQVLDDCDLAELVRIHHDGGTRRIERVHRVRRMFRPKYGMGVTGSTMLRRKAYGSADFRFTPASARKAV